MFLSKYGVARHIYIPMVKRAVVDFAVGADWTPAAGDVKISKDGGAAANVTNLPTSITMGNTAMWDFSLTATEMQAAQVVVTVADSATKAVEDTQFDIETYGNASAQHAVDLSDSVRAGLTALPNAAAEAAGGLYTRGTGAGQINQDANGRVDVSLKAILGTTLTETAGQIAAAFKKFFDKATPTGTINSIPDAVAGAAGGLFIAGTNAPVTITGSGDALTLSSTGANGSGLAASGNGSGDGIKGTGGATGRGIEGVGGASGGAGIRGVGTAGNANGVEGVGQGSASGIAGTGGATGAGINGVGGATSGVGIIGTAPTSGAGIQGVGGGAGDGITGVGGASGGGDGISGVAGGGVDIRGNITGNVTGNLSGSAGSVTGAVGSVGAGGIIAASFGVDAIDATALKADAVAEIWASATRTLTGSQGIKKNTAKAAFMFAMTDSTTHAPATGLTVTATRSLDGAAFASCANSVVEVASGWYKIDLAAADLNGDTVALKFTATGGDQLNISLVTSP